MAHRFQQMPRAIDVGGKIDIGIFDAVAHPGAGGEIEHRVESVTGKHAIHQFLRFDVALDEGQPLPAPQRLHAVLLQAHIIGVVEIVDRHDFHAAVEQLRGDAGGDESGGAGEQDFLHVLWD